MYDVATLGPLGRFSAFGVAAAGFVALVAGVQEAALVTFREAWMSGVPLGQAALGLAALILAWKLAHPRAAARVPALLVLFALGAGGAAWALFLMWNGLFTALSVLAPITAAGAGVGVLVGWREVGRIGALRRAAERETERLIREALAAGEPVPRERAWVLPLTFSILGVPVALFAVAVFAPALWGWGEVRVRGLMAGRSPFASGWVEQATAYPYSGSPLLWYLEYEAKWVPLPEDEIEGFADGIARDVGWRLAAATGEPDPVKAEQALWAAGRQHELPLWVADAIRARNVFYSPESLFSRSFDPTVHVQPDTVHLDCDQLVYVFLHVAWRLDLAMAAVPSPMHVYLRYGGPDGQPPLYVETTQFRHIDESGNHVDFMGAGIGETFFIDADYYRSGRGGSWAAPDVADAAGLYEPWTERDIRDAIVANVMVGVEREKPDAPVIEELEAHAAGSREITLVTNLYSHYVDRAEDELSKGDRDGARADATRAAEIRTTHPGLVIFNERKEDAILAALE